MSKSDYFENAFLSLIFNSVTISELAGNVGTNSVLYVSLHTADPGEAGNQSTNEVTYTSYGRVSVPRTTAGWKVTTNTVSPTSIIDFPAGTGGSSTATYFGIGTAASGAGKLLYSGPITPSIICGDGITPRILTSTVVSED